MREPTAFPEIPPGPLESAPRVDAPPGQTMAAARDAWRHALRGLPMGAYDLRIAYWVEDVADQATLLTLASLLERARVRVRRDDPHPTRGGPMTVCNCADDEACDGCVPCDICREGLEECCDGDPDCPGCYGAGCRIPEHCCDCGGSACFGGCRSLAAHAADTLPTTTTPDTEASGEDAA